MSRRKGELSKSSIDAGWPYQVSLPATYVRANLKMIDRRAQELSACERQHCYYADNDHHNVYCFATEADATAFHQEFGGRRVTPKDRPTWPWGNRK